MKKLALGLLLGLLPLVGFGQRELISLNRNWSFSPGWDLRARAGRQVNLPHTWNASDAFAGDGNYYRGMGNYSKVIEVPQGWAGKRIFIRFAGANSVCDLYVNGKHVGQHKGGYTAFGWDISKFLNYGDRNTIWARVNNAQDPDLAPLAGSFNKYGGLYRNVDLIVVPDAYIGDDNGSAGLYATTTEVREGEANVHVSAAIGGTRGTMVITTLVLRDAAGNGIDSLTRRIKLGDNGKSRIEAAFTVKNPKLWNGTEDPYRYRVEARVSTDKGHDAVAAHFGIRTVRVDNKNQFYLNNNPLRVHGVVRIEDWAGLGNALHHQNHKRDIALMKEMGVNAVRLAYFPNDPYFIDLCDQAGILVWSEIPLAGTGTYRNKGYNDSELYRANAKRQLGEMIGQYYNHPSIVWWGLFDQLTQLGDDPLPFVKELNKLAKEESGGRLTVAASNQDGDLNFVTDLIGFNQFMGWTAGLPEDFDAWTKDLRRGFPKLNSAVSAYGAGANIYQHSDSTSKPDLAGAWHPEEWQTRFHEEYWRVISSGNHFWGTFAWTMFDYGWAAKTEGLQPGINDHGLVTFDRAVKKDAFYFYKANWNQAEPFVYITGRRWDKRSGRVQDFKVYGNMPGHVELFVNGISQGLKEHDKLGRFVWKSINLKEGDNLIEARDLLSGKQDRITITVTPQTKLPELSGPASGRRSR